MNFEPGARNDKPGKVGGIKKPAVLSAQRARLKLHLLAQ